MSSLPLKVSKKHSESMHRHAIGGSGKYAPYSSQSKHVLKSLSDAQAQLYEVQRELIRRQSWDITCPHHGCPFNLRLYAPRGSAKIIFRDSVGEEALSNFGHSHHIQVTSTSDGIECHWRPQKEEADE